MKTEELNLTIDELDKLCHLYIDCKLSVLEEKEFEYILSKTALTSSSIEEVRSLMGIQILPVSSSKQIRAKHNWNWRLFSGIAASVIIIISVAFFLVSPQENIQEHDGSSVFITAYCHGKHLNEQDAIASTNIAMAKADSLMRYAAITERYYMMRANDIISETSNN